MSNNTTIKKTFGMDLKVCLSTLWIFVTANYLYCDVLSLMDPKFLKDLLAGTGSIQMTQGLLMGASILMEIPMAMIILSRVLKGGTNRWVNIITGTIMTGVQIATLVAGDSTSFYVFFSIIEILCTSFIVLLAWKWRNPNDKSYE